MGIVYLAEGHAGKRVALKVIRPELAEDDYFRARFKSEIEAAKRVDGFCTAQVVAAEVGSDSAYLATEFIEGPTLRGYIEEQGPIANQNLTTFALGLAEALVAIHRAGVIHRDLKPSNIIISDAGPRVIDFGIARATDATAMTKTGTTLGTPAWMAPEQLQGQPVGQAADVFAWGCLVAYAASGVPPFGEGPTDAVSYRIVHEEPALRDLPPGLRGLVERAVAKDATHRPSAESLALKLLSELNPDAASDDLPTEVRRVLDRTWENTVSQRQPQRRRRRRVLLVGGLVLMMAAAVTTAVALVMSSDPSTPASRVNGGVEASGKDRNPGELTRVFPSDVSASQTAPDGIDASGNPISYDAANVADGKKPTAWRVEGSGVGQVLTLSFPEAISVKRIGLIPGYAKVDATDGTNRFQQERVVKSVEYGFDGGAEESQTFRNDPALQTIDVDVETASITVTVLRVSAPGDSNYDFTPISEIAVWSVAATDSSRPLAGGTAAPGLSAEEACVTRDEMAHPDEGVGPGCFWVGAAVAEQIHKPFAGYGSDPGVFGSGAYETCLSLGAYTVDVLAGNVPGVGGDAHSSFETLRDWGLSDENASEMIALATDFLEQSSGNNESRAAVAVAARVIEICERDFHV